MENSKNHQLEIIHILVCFCELAKAGGIFEIESHLHLADGFDYLAEAAGMMTEGTDPGILRGHLTGLVESENDPDTKLLKKIVATAVPMIQSGTGTPVSVRLKLLALADPDTERLYFEKRLVFERRKNKFYDSSLLLKTGPDLVNPVEKIFLYMIISGNPFDIAVIGYHITALALLGCSRPVQIKIFEQFPYIEAENFLDFYSPEKIKETDVIEAMRKVEEWGRRQMILKEKIAIWQNK